MDSVCKNMKHSTYDSNDEDSRRCARLLQFYTERINGPNDIYSFKFFFCELLNLINVVIQMWLTDYFLNGAFKQYGHELLNYIQNGEGHFFQPFLDSNALGDSANPADVVFPKVSVPNIDN